MPYSFPLFGQAALKVMRWKSKKSQKLKQDVLLIIAFPKKKKKIPVI
jgi:hypothetical protein